MGLDCTHDCWHGSYSAFNRWRDKLAEVAGYTFSPCGDPFETHGMKVIALSRLQPDLDWGNIEKTIGRDLLGKWPQIPVRPDGTPDPLIILLAHPDCEGELQWEFLDDLANRLEDLLPELEGLDGGGHVGNYSKTTQRFIDGLRHASEARENVGFH